MTKVYSEFFPHISSHVHNFATPLVKVDGSPDFHAPWTKEGAYQDWYSHGASLVDLVDDIQHADIIVLSIDWFWVRRFSWRCPENTQLKSQLIDIVDGYKQVGKPVLVFFTGDRSCEPIALKDVFIARESAYASRMTLWDRVQPAFCEDLLDHYCSGVVETPLQKPETPVLGFCGLARAKRLRDPLLNCYYHLKHLYKLGLWDVSPYKGEVLRERLICQLDGLSQVKTNFILRDRSLFVGEPDADIRRNMRLEYIDNMRASHYVLCVRGSGNFSYRFYESLCMGKIPVLIDTDTSLPFENEVQWDRHIVRLPEAEVARVEAFIMAFHNKLSDTEFVRLCDSNRRLWLEYFTPQGFYPRLLGDISQNAEGQ